MDRERVKLEAGGAIGRSCKQKMVAAWTCDDGEKRALVINKYEEEETELGVGGKRGGQILG